MLAHLARTTGRRAAAVAAEVRGQRERGRERERGGAGDEHTTARSIDGVPPPFLSHAPPSVPPLPTGPHPRRGRGRAVHHHRRLAGGRGGRRRPPAPVGDQLARRVQHGEGAERKKEWGRGGRGRALGAPVRAHACPVRVPERGRQAARAKQKGGREAGAQRQKQPQRRRRRRSRPQFLFAPPPALSLSSINSTKTRRPTTRPPPLTSRPPTTTASPPCSPTTPPTGRRPP